MVENKKLKILVKEPGKEAYLKEITYDLKSMQEVVDGYIECVQMPNVEGVDLYVNEEGKLENLEGNFWLPEYEDCVMGTCFFVGFDEELGKSIDITEKQIEKCKEYLRYFSIPKEYDIYKDEDIPALIKLREIRKQMYAQLRNNDAEMD